MLVFCADYVGYEIVKYLCGINEHIKVLIYDRENRGNYNNSIIQMVSSCNSDTAIYEYNELQNESIYGHIKNMSIKYGFLLWWPYIVDKRIINLTTQGLINVHPSYLPYGRGKHPYFWNIVEGNPHGVTIHFVDELIDNGPIILQKQIPVTWEDNGDTLFLKARNDIIDLFCSNYLTRLKDNIQVQQMTCEDGTFHYGYEMDKFSQIELDKDYTARQLLNIIRGQMHQGKGRAFILENGEKYFLSIKIEKDKQEEIL